MNTRATSNTVCTVDAELLLQEMRSNRRVAILDVRSREEFFGPSGRLPGASSLPMESFAPCEAPTACHPSEQVVTVSWTDGRSYVAARRLEAAGFTEVRALQGGLRHWLDLGFPTEGTGTSTNGMHGRLAIEIVTPKARCP